MLPKLARDGWAREMKSLASAGAELIERVRDPVFDASFRTRRR
jgi:hypothetical protein